MWTRLEESDLCSNVRSVVYSPLYEGEIKNICCLLGCLVSYILAQGDQRQQPSADFRQQYMILN